VNTTEPGPETDWNDWGPPVRMRVSVPVAREARRGPMEVTFFQTEWRDLDGAPVVTEQIVSLFFPQP
jgi:hypothetical protein